MSHAPRPHVHSAVASVSACRPNLSATSFSGSTSRCGSGDFDLSGLDSAGKLRFAEQCGASFPCATGAVDYSGCPVGFAKSGSKCIPTAAYDGARGPQDFSQYNAKMLASWEG